MRASPFLFTLCLLAACRLASPPAQTLTVSAAASLTGAFTEIGSRFESTHPGVRVAFNFAGSQQLAQQIIQGAPADVFASADRQQIDAVVQAGLIQPAGVLPLVGNRLVVVLPASNPARLATLADLARPGVKLVLADQAVPVGAYSLQFLDKAAADPSLGPAYPQAVLANVLSYEENVRAVLSKVAIGEADAGIVYASDAVSATPATPGRTSGFAQVQVMEIPSSLNVQAEYFIAPLANSSDPTLADAFTRYTLSEEAQAILTRYGFTRSR